MLITSGGADIPEVRTTAGSAAGAQHRVAQPAAVPVDRRRAGRPRVLLRARTRRCARSTRPAPARGRRYGQRDAINRDYGGHALYDVGKILVAGGGPSTHDARVDRHQRRDPAGRADRADGVRAPAAQPDGARRRHRARDRRQLVGRGAGRPQRRRLRRRAVEPGDRHVDDAGGRCR